MQHERNFSSGSEIACDKANPAGMALFGKMNLKKQEESLKKDAFSVIIVR